MVSPKQHITSLVASVARNFFGGHRKVGRVGNPYFYGADRPNTKTAVKNFARNGGSQTIGMFSIIPSRDILSTKSKYCMGFDVRPTL